MDYLFKSERLGFRPWTQADYELLNSLCGDPLVMKHFPSTLNPTEVQEFLDRLQLHYKTNGYCYFLAELRATGAGIGFIGLAYQNYESEYTPCVDIGYRLFSKYWGQGLATEGSRFMIEVARDYYNLKQLRAFATQGNKDSIAVMQRIGMQYVGSFTHPKLLDYPKLANCVTYQIEL